MKKHTLLLMACLFFSGSACTYADSIHDRLFKELDNKLAKYDTVDFRNIEGIPTYILNLKGTDLDIVEAYLRTLKDEVVLYERAEDGRWIKQALKRYKSKHT